MTPVRITKLDGGRFSVRELYVVEFPTHAPLPLDRRMDQDNFWREFNWILNDETLRTMFGLLMCQEGDSVDIISDGKIIQPVPKEEKAPQPGEG